MSELKKIQQEFISFLRDKDSSIAESIVSSDSDDKNTRLNIYRFAYEKRLSDAIDNDHPVLGQYLGDDWFADLVQSYLAKHPSQVFSLRHFCDALPEFLRIEPPFSEHPILSEIAQFERLLLCAFDAPEMPVQNIEDLQAIDAHVWPQLRIRFQPSVQLFIAHWNSVESWHAIKAENPPEPATEGVNKNWLIWRNQERLTEFRSISRDELYMLQTFLQGANFSFVCEGLLEWHAPEQVSMYAVSYLTRWLNEGIVIKLET
ncbi:DUF2063 domain-containing protein [Pleionea sp. CnH1-48]|uniref:HvfC/BufC N-terminal domain-containing protein n=1 Tax=Pleionea sp. CnH1-48 TaxID=2954494 RepID=UPI002096E307|nr:DNA-binding domain-containing protein [Pleionea sp. CnH1-48]MCO7227160.1 DNA-binding domain-containing protein [Pleionea sp. CnH1-48]